MKRKQLCIVLVTVRSRKEGRAIAGMLLKRKLAACVNLLPLVESHFWWNGKIDRASECLLVIKSIRSHFRQLAATVRLHHSYQVPEIIALPLAAAERAYASWWKKSLQPK